MKSLKTLFLGTTFAIGLLFGTQAFADTLHTVKPGDTLSEISTQYFGNKNAIDKIAQDNNIKDIHFIYVGQQLTIKTDSNAQTTNTQTVDSTESEQAVEPVQTVQPAQQQETVQADYAGQSSSAKEWIAQKESGGSYSATNGHHIGRYQLDPSYLNGDHSPANQERVADNYVENRYGSWENAKTFWLNNGWY
ncbi:aggregation-promoting factor [Vagococcus vulneris]|uniref:Peptidase M23 n=1 Tax=Vagococcus vulneris TaxID=1977869 RepID=A0A429ZX69_9ENTE|nr:LysM domain-containing protein [Vagococcus vulneris]RST98415.1 peptidase M23 [Vagococcus vulneris]